MKIGARVARSCAARGCVLPTAAWLEPDGGASPESVRRTIDDVLARPEFRRGARPPNALDRLLEKIAHFLSELFGIPTGAGAELLFWSVVVILAGLLGWLAWRIVARRLRERDAAGSEPQVPDPETLRRERVADLRRRAAEAERRGEHVLALRLYFTALVVGLGEKGDLDYRDAWTNRELFERGEPSPAVARALAPLVESLDRHSFGGVPAGPDEVSAMARLVDGHLGARVS